MFVFVLLRSSKQTKKKGKNSKSLIKKTFFELFFLMKLFVSKSYGELASIKQWYYRQKAVQAVGKVRLVESEKGISSSGDDELLTVELVEAPSYSPASSSSSASSLSFDAGRYFCALDVQGLRAAGRRLLVADATRSTQEVLQEHCAGWEGWRIAMVADRQTAGRGRGENAWSSPIGCLMTSFQVVQTQGARLPMLQYLVALALVKAVKRLPGGVRVAEQIKIKWPNDLYCCVPEETPVKLGGILCQSSYFLGQFTVTIGFGVNVTNEHPTKCLKQLFEPSPEDVSRETLLAAFFTVFEPMLDEFDRSGFSSFKAEYEHHWMHSQQKLTLEDGSTVVVEGLTDEGLLQACDLKTGLRHELQPDGNSLDWFKGLVKKKR